MHFTAEIRQPRKAQTIIQRIQQREIHMTAIDTQVECRTVRDRPLNAEIGIIRKVQTEKINRQILSMQQKGRACPFHRNRTVTAVQDLRAAVDRERGGICALTADAEIGVQPAAYILRHGNPCRTQLRKRNTIRRQMRRIGFVSCRKNTRTRDRSAEDLCRQILKRERAVSIGDIRRRICHGNTIDRPARRTQLPFRHGDSERPRNVHIRRCCPHIGTSREKLINGNVICPQHEIEIGFICIKTNRPINTRCLPRCRDGRREKKLTLAERERRTPQLGLRAVDLCRSTRTIHAPIQGEHAVHAAQMQPDVICTHIVNMNILGQCPRREEVQQRGHTRIIRVQPKIVCPSDIVAAHTQGNAGERTHQIVGNIAAVNLHRSRNAGQRVRTSACGNIRRRILHADASLKRTRLAILCAEIAVVPRTVATLHNRCMCPRKQDLVNRGFGR